MLAQIPVVPFPLALILLLPPDILNLDVQIANLVGQLRDMRSVLLNIRPCRAHHDVNGNAQMGMTEPGGIVGRKADGMVA